MSNEASLGEKAYKAKHASKGYLLKKKKVGGVTGMYE